MELENAFDENKDSLFIFKIDRISILVYDLSGYPAWHQPDISSRIVLCLAEYPVGNQIQYPAGNMAGTQDIRPSEYQATVSGNQMIFVQYRYRMEYPPWQDILQVPILPSSQAGYPVIPKYI